MYFLLFCCIYYTTFYYGRQSKWTVYYNNNRNSRWKNFFLLKKYCLYSICWAFCMSIRIWQQRSIEKKVKEQTHTNAQTCITVYATDQCIFLSLYHCLYIYKVFPTFYLSLLFPLSQLCVCIDYYIYLCLLSRKLFWWKKEWKEK